MFRLKKENTNIDEYLKNKARHNFNQLDKAHTKALHNVSKVQKLWDLDTFLSLYSRDPENWEQHARKFNYSFEDVVHYVGKANALKHLTYQPQNTKHPKLAPYIKMGSKFKAELHNRASLILELFQSSENSDLINRVIKNFPDSRWPSRAGFRFSMSAQETRFDDFWRLIKLLGIPVDNFQFEIFDCVNEYNLIDFTLKHNLSMEQFSYTVPPNQNWKKLENMVTVKEIYGDTNKRNEFNEKPVLTVLLCLMAIYLL